MFFEIYMMYKLVTSAQTMHIVDHGYRRAKPKSAGARKPVTPVTSLHQRGVVWNLV